MPINIALLVTVAIVIFISYTIGKSKLFQRKCNDAFHKVYGEKPFSPKQEFSYSYGYPSITIIFESDSDLDRANKEGVNSKFTEIITELCKNTGSKTQPFDVERAVWFTSKEKLDAIQNKYGKKIPLTKQCTRRGKRS